METNKTKASLEEIDRLLSLALDEAVRIEEEDFMRIGLPISMEINRCRSLVSKHISSLIPWPNEEN